MSAVDAWVAADYLAMHGQRESDDGGSTSSAALASMPPNAFAVTLFCLESRRADYAVCRSFSGVLLCVSVHRCAVLRCTAVLCNT